MFMNYLGRFSFRTALIACLAPQLVTAACRSGSGSFTRSSSATVAPGFGKVSVARPQRYRSVPIKKLPNLLRPAQFDTAKYPNFAHLQGLLTCKHGKDVCASDEVDGLKTGITWNSLAEAEIIDDHTLRFKIMGSKIYGFNPKVVVHIDQDSVYDAGDVYDLSLESPTKGKLIKSRYDMKTGELTPIDPSTYRFDMVYLGDGTWLRTSALQIGRGDGPLVAQEDYYLVQAFDENGPTKHWNMALDDAKSTNTTDFLVTVDADSDLGRGAPIPGREYDYVDDIDAANVDAADAAAGDRDTSRPNSPDMGTAKPKLR